MGSNRSHSGHTCFECGKQADHAHHVIPFTKGGKRTLPLCAECHSLVHGHGITTSALIKAGIERAKAKGKKMGRPRKDVDPTPMLVFKREGYSIREIAVFLKLSPSAVHRTIKKAERKEDEN